MFLLTCSVLVLLVFTLTFSSFSSNSFLKRWLTDAITTLWHLTVSPDWQTRLTSTRHEVDCKDDNVQFKWSPWDPGPVHLTLVTVWLLELERSISKEGQYLTERCWPLKSPVTQQTAWVTCYERLQRPQHPARPTRFTGCGGQYSTHRTILNMLKMTGTNVANVMKN